MEKIEVIILEDGISAKEVNPYIDELERKEKLGHTIPFGLINSFRSYESSLRTFKIDNIRGLSMDDMPSSIQETMSAGIGTRHEAMILADGKIGIL